MAQTIRGFTVKQNEIPGGQCSDLEELAVAIGNSSPARKVGCVFFSFQTFFYMNKFSLHNGVRNSSFFS